MKLQDIKDEYDLKEYLESLDATQEMKDIISKIYDQAFWIGHREGEIFASHKY